MTDRLKKISNTLETYFSEANLLWDKLLVSLITKDEKGFVTFDALSKLAKFKQLEATPEEIKQAAEAHSVDKFNIEETRISRFKPFVLNKKEELDEWSIYVEGLSRKYEDERKIVELFQKHVGHVSFTRIPKNRNNEAVFAGFCFVEFGTREHVQKAVDVFKTNGLDLRVISKLEWLKYRDEYLAVLKKEKDKFKELWREYNANHPKELRSEDHKIEEPPAKKRKMRESPAKEHRMEYTKEEEIEYPKGVIVLVQKLHFNAPKTVVLKLLEKSGVKVPYMKPKRKGMDQTHIRLETPEDAIKLHKYFESHHVIQEDGKDAEGKQVDNPSFETIKTKIIQGKEEELYWEEDLNNRPSKD